MLIMGSLCISVNNNYVSDLIEFVDNIVCYIEIVIIAFVIMLLLGTMLLE